MNERTVLRALGFNRAGSKEVVFSFISKIIFLTALRKITGVILQLCFTVYFRPFCNKTGIPLEYDLVV